VAADLNTRLQGQELAVPADLVVRMGRGPTIPDLLHLARPVCLLLEYTDMDQAALTRSLTYAQANLDGDVSLGALAAAANCSPRISRAASRK
jgi:hypothetical protein